MLFSFNIKFSDKIIDYILNFYKIYLVFCLMVKVYMWIKGDLIDYLVCLKWNRGLEIYFL